ncbi:small glutamine-rich tetratricopeptide repeat-containing protein-like isoform X2 [Iris pallida]|uniref:Small glutamine-rich tetratricopeptide repeat-containing protein-like isoform X2 n=1 Tax=Iris pallida TaxID=29817 RepID=A0AAX6FJ67_IRIPA|nr:small glutamine-rich tetratricopeptide repeat-containing protein-like isoform X2 [Iris pallida]
MLVGNSEEPSEPEIRIASSNTGLHHEQTWTTRSTGPSNPRISTRVLPVGTRIPPSIKSIYGTTSESTEQMNSSTQSTSSPSIPAAVVNFFRTMDTASPSHQGRDSRPNENQEASVGTLIPPSFRNMYGTTLESTRPMNSNKQYTSSPSIPADVVNFFRTLHTASPSHQGHDSIPNGNQEASVGSLTPPSFTSIYGTTFESTGQMSSSTQSTSSPSIPADVVNFFRTLHTASPSHQGHDSIPNGKFFRTLHTASQSHQGRDSIPNGNQEASVGTLTPPSFTSIYGTTFESTGQMNSSTQSTSSPSIPADVVNFFRTLHTASPSHQGHDSIPNGKFFRTLHTASQSHQGRDSIPNGNQEASVGTLTPPSFTSIYGTTFESTGQMNSSTQSTSSPSIPADVVNFFRTLHTASQCHQGRDSIPNGNQEASVGTLTPPSFTSIYGTTLESTGQMNSSTQSTSSPSIPADVVNFFRTLHTASQCHQGHDSIPNGNQEASVGTLTTPSFTSIYGTTLESTGQMNSSTQSTSSPSIPADVVSFFRNMHTASQSHQGHDSRPNGNQEASGQRNSSMYITSSPIAVPPAVVNWLETMFATPHSHHNDQSRQNGNQDASGQRSSRMYTTSSAVAIPPDVINLYETMSATNHSHHGDQSRPNGNKKASGSDRT